MNKKIIFLSLFFLLVGFVWKVSPVDASSFSNTYIRLDNQTPNAPLSGTVCAQASSADAGTEAKITIVFPSDFTISANPTNWTTNLNNLPSGATSWPGIGSPATGVSGQSVTFSSGDLTDNVLYCFNFSGKVSKTGAAGDGKDGTITTKNSSNTTIDSTIYYLSILDNNQIPVTATVQPDTTYLPIAIESTTGGDNFPQNTTLNYKITYGLLTVGDFPLTIQAQWSQGTIAGSPTPSVDIVDYVIGSASDAYGSVPAIVDTVNNTLTWTIPSFPGNTLNKTVTFSLRTNDSYTGLSNVSFDVSARAISGATVTPDQTVTQDYLYSASLEPTPTPTPGQTGQSPTPTPGPSNGTTGATTPTPTPTTAAPPSFSQIEVQALSDSQAQIAIGTNSNATYTVVYGTSPNALSQTITSLTALTGNSIVLPDLIPDTNYYFKVVAKDASGKVIGSDIYTFQTAAVSEAPLIDSQSLLVTSNDNVLVSPAKANAPVGQTIAANAITIPQSSVFDIRFSLKKDIAIKSIQIIVKSKVLGANTFSIPQAEADTNFANLTEISPGVFSGRLKSLPSPGNYEIFVRIVDYNGNIIEQKLTDLIVTPKLAVYDKANKSGIEHVRALLYLYNEGTRTYEAISPQILPIPNPIFSQSSGEYDLVLPYGKYRVELSAIGYKSQTVEFAVTPRGGYPAIYLTPNFNIISIAQYYLSTLSDALTTSQIYFQEQAQSNRLFALSTIGAVIFLVGITILSISARTHITVFYLPYFLFFRLNLIFRRDKARIIFGKVIDEKTEAPISRAKVYLSTLSGNHVLAALVTNKLGEFYYKNTKGLDYKITVIKEGYASPEPWEFINNKVKQIPTILKMEEQGKPHHSILEVISLYVEDFMGICMEALVLFGLLIQIYFIFTFGFLKVAPSICLTIINLLLILTYLYKPRGLWE
jgi:hypothetical protein